MNQFADYVNTKSVVVTSETGVVEFEGTPQDLIDDDLIFPEWIPILPKRCTHSKGNCDWVGLPAKDERETWTAKVLHWTLRRVSGGRYRLCVVALNFRLYRGGPLDPDSGWNTVEHHRAMVRARRNVAFRQFLDRVQGADPAAAK